MVSVSNVAARATGSGNSVVPLLATPCSASLHQLYAGTFNLGIARDWFVNCVTFSSTVMRCTRSAARCSAGNAGFRYAGGAAFWAEARHAIRIRTITGRILKFDVRMSEWASIRNLQFLPVCKWILLGAVIVSLY